MSGDLVPIVLCGGAGTRLWPMSRKLLPKQFLPLITDRTMLQETAVRAATVTGSSPPYIVCSEEHRFLAAEQMLEIGIAPAGIVLEPVARNTAPALAAAAMAIAETDPATVMLVLPADHLIADINQFSEAIKISAAIAATGALVTFGIVPQGAETGYGYIERGDAMGGGGFRVARFVEKPDAARARTFVESGRYFWNSGMFVITAGRYLAELEKFRPDILGAVAAAWSGRKVDVDFCRLDAKAFAACPADSIDYAVMERTADAAVVPADMGWSDVGSWAMLWETAGKSPDGNGTRGDADLHDTRNSYVRAESRLVSVSGVDNLVVVETSDAVLVTHRDKSQAVKDVVSRLDVGTRTEHLSHRRVYRPWGYYESIDAGARYQVKRLMIKPGAILSLQLHHQRAEHWVVVSGTARVTRDNEVMDLVANHSTYIPVGSKHRLENTGKDPLFVIEVQSGDYLGEDDIVRFEDRYSRA